MRKLVQTKTMRIPEHIAIIMDGNGRWAKQRMMPRSYGHSKGIDRMAGLFEKAFDLGINYVTVYALSTENLKRPKEELEFLFGLMRERFEGSIAKVCQKGVRFRAIGDLSLLPQDIRDILKKAEDATAQYTGKGINFAVCYGARAEIVRAVNMAVEKGKKVTEEEFSSLLYTANQPEVDLIIRTGKEVRLSNFLLYQAAYAELYFSDKMFPEFSDKDLEKAIAEYSRRTRRFGKTDEQIEKKESNS